MNYNLHPIFVHFPIAFFLLYSAWRLFPWPKKLSITDWHFPRTILLIAGLLGAWLSNATGEIAADLTHPNEQLVEMHESFAGASVNLYLILLIAELLFFIKPEWLNNKYLLPAKPLLIFLQRLFTKLWIFRTLALIGAILIAITGLLGGVMVYGVSADPPGSTDVKITGIIKN